MKLKRCFPVSLIFLMFFPGCEKTKELEPLPENLQEDIMDLPPLKESFAAYFDLFGTVFNEHNINADGTGFTDKWLTRHFNTLSVGNELKPEIIAPNKEGVYDFTIGDLMVDTALASGFKVVGHVLLWHSQIPQWQRDLASANKETALASMKKYITDVVTHYKGRIYLWDVLNEAFLDSLPAGLSEEIIMQEAASFMNSADLDAMPEGFLKKGASWKTSMRTRNPWFKSIGSDFVYEGFLAARLADPDAILCYNDFNTDQIEKAKMIRDMVRDVNKKYKKNFPKENRLLIEVIGMQEHHNTEVSAENIEKAIKLFRPLGVKLFVSELDVLGQPFFEFLQAGHGLYRQEQSTVTKSGLEKQARLYRDLFRVYIKHSDIIDNVTLWGVTDDQSWRSAGLPLLFDSNGKAKTSYYAVMDALKTAKAPSK